MNNPKWLSGYISDKALGEIELAVKNAEQHTSGEIVPIIIDRSSVVSHVPMVIFAVLSLLFVVVDYNGFITHLFPYEVPYSAFFVIFLLLGFVFGQFPSLQRVFQLKADLKHQVQVRAMQEFYLSNIYKTRDRTGILIYISIMERQVVVLADQGIAEKLPTNTWDEVIQLVLQGKRQKDLAAGIIQGIHRCGELLHQEFPIKEDDKNELNNKLVIKSF